MTLLTLLKSKGPSGGGGVPDPLGTFVADNVPRLIVEIDFANDPTTVDRVWTDVTTFVRDIQYQRDGRQHELQRTETGTLTAVLSNRDGRFDPTFTGATGGAYGAGDYGPGDYGGGGSSVTYYPGVKRTRWIRARAVWNSSPYTRWQGLIENYDGEWPSYGMDATVTITASTPMKILNLYDLNGLAFPEQNTGQRVVEVAAAAGFNIIVADFGVSTVPAVAFTSPTSALSHLQQVEETENGLIYMDENGDITFEDRHSRLTSTAGSLGTIGDLPGEIPYGPVRFEYDDSNIWNHAVVTPAADPELLEPATPGDAEDATSIATHYERTLNRSILVQDVNEAQSAAEYLVQIYKDPPPRISTVEVIGRAAPTLWPLILTARNSDQYVWRRRPSTEAGSRTIELPVYVERVADQITPGSNWTTTLQLSPAATTFGWILGTSGLGVDTALMY